MLVIRTYETADYDAVWRLHRAALQAVGADAGEGPWEDDLRAIEATYLASGGAFLVGLLDGQIVAMAALRPKGPGAAEVKRMRVLPAHQRRGFGGRMLAALEEHARRRGFATLQLDTTVQQHAAQRLYERHGFQEVRRGRMLGFDCIFYEKQLGAAER
jgi:ribosomal protein S18 acetylase RimI-like enzyme